VILTGICWPRQYQFRGTDTVLLPLCRKMVLVQARPRVLWKYRAEGDIDKTFDFSA